MREWLPRIVILGLLLIVVGVPFLVRPREVAQGEPIVDPQLGELQLVIMSPHNQQIRNEVGAAFNRHRKALGLAPVVFDWRTSGGTSDLRKQIVAEYENALREGREQQGVGYDLFFGGGDYEHNQLVKGITRPDGSRIALSTPIPIAPELLKEIFPDPMLGSEALYQKDLHWVGVVLSAFGIVYNRDALSRIGYADDGMPQTWSDLADPQLYNWVALADPAKSGSIATAFNVILRRMGWIEGWATLRRVYANSRYFTSSATKVPVDVSAGEAAAGMCIDFYGRFQAGAIGENRVGYVDPPFMTATGPDPISVMLGAPHRQLAEQFVLWLLTPDAQALWQRRVGVPGGPEQFELRRLPIRRDVYTSAEMQHWTDQVNPFETSKPYPKGIPEFRSAIALMSHAMAMDIHDDLRSAWKAMIDHPNHPRRAEMVALFDQMPQELTLQWPDPSWGIDQKWMAILAEENHPQRARVEETLAAFVKSLNDRWKDSDQQLRDRLAFTKFFQDNYQQIVRLAQSDALASRP